MEQVILLAIFGFINAILWLVIGWRAMRAHERLADAAWKWVSRVPSSEKLSPAFPFPRPKVPIKPGEEPNTP